MLVYAIIVAALSIIVAIAHSMISERRLLGPLYREPQSGILATKQMQDIFRAVFHMPSLAWAGLGVAVLLNRQQGGTDLLPYVAMIIFALSGAGNLVALRRPHPGGIILLLAAIATFADIWFN